MRQRQSPLPRVWLMTDERIADLLPTIRRLPNGAGIVFRHHATPPAERKRLFQQVRAEARRARRVLLLADTPQSARQWRADGAHHRGARPSTASALRSVAVHNAREMAMARRVGADLVFVSPVFATRSHPDARTLGVARTGLIAGTWRGRTVALGGMSATRWKRIAALGLHGWAAINGLTP